MKKQEEINNYLFETKLYENGFELIAGVDEVGRGPLIGPVVSAAVIMPKNCYIEGVTDSKKLSAKKRKLLKEEITKKALAIGISFVDASTIDQINIYEASKLAMKDALSKLKIKPEFVLIDAMPLELDVPTYSIIKGDLKSYMMGCASIIAKEARDDYMKELAITYPMYGFEKNMGYPTKEHLEAIKKYGITALHRKSYKPIADAIVDGIKEV